MIKKYKYLKDYTFLKSLDKSRIQQYYVKITVLDWYERPIQDIQGKVTSANIILDGSSSVRRTANISMIADGVINDLTNVDNLISINKKVNIEIGFTNNMNRYTEYSILWFPLGIYVIISPSISHSTSDVTISLQLKDKMCLLNGECGGTIPASVTLDNYDDVDEEGNDIIVRPTIYQIIQQLVNHFGNEQLSKIIISDVDTRIKAVMKWTGSSQLYILRKDKDTPIITADQQQANNYINEGYVHYQGSPFASGEDVGYIYTDFTYPGDLIANAGDSVCTILDKIKNTLGNYEYFYDLNGNFIFQEIKNYLNNSQSKVILDNISKDKLDYTISQNHSKSVYQFNSSQLVSSYSNTPQYGNIKNDFVIWGQRSDASGNTWPIRYHLAIDKKPFTGNVYQCIKYTDPDDKLEKLVRPYVYNGKGEPIINNPVPQTFYINIDNEIFKYTKSNEDNVLKWIQITDAQLITLETQDWRTELYLQGVSAAPYSIDSNFYYTQLANEWPKIFQVTLDANGKWKDHVRQEIVKDYSSIDYYLDFIDTTSKVNQFSVDNIGRRTYTVNSDDINCIFEKDIPDLVLIENGQTTTTQLRQQCINRNQNYVQIDSSIYSLLAVGGMFNSAYQNIRQMLHSFLDYSNSISLSTIPIYYLQPNTRITVNDSESNIYGDYIINNISISLGGQNQMSISATKALERI